MKKQLKLERMLLVMALVVGITNAKAQVPTYAWAISEGGSDFDGAQSVVTDAAGDIITTGYFTGTVDFDPGPATFFLTASSSNFYVQKLNRKGQLVWARTFVSSSYNAGNALDVDHLGNIYVTGSFEGTVDFDPGAGTFNLSSFNANSDVFVLKLNSVGKFVWAKSFGGAYSDYPHSISIGLKGVHIAGYFHDIVDFDPGPGTDIRGASNIGQHAFVQKLELSGNYLWTRVVTSVHTVVPLSVHVDAYENVLSSGYFAYCTADFDPGAGTFNLTAPNVEGYIQKLDRNGNFLWARALNGAGAVGDAVHVVLTDATGNVITTGRFYGTSDFDYGLGVFNVTPSGASDIFVHKMDPNGNFTWVKTFGGPSIDIESEVCTSTVLDNVGNIYNVGHFYGTMDFDPGLGTTNFSSSSTGSEMFLQKLDMNGNFLWTRAYGGLDYETATSVTLDPDLSIVTCGSYQGTSDFDPDSPVRNLTSNGFTDLFVQKIGQCTGSLTASITETLNPTPPYSTNSLNAVVSGSPGPFNYRWTRGGAIVSTTSQVISPCSGATYVLTATDQATGCVATASYYFNNSNNAYCSNPGGPGGLGLEDEQAAYSDWIVFPNPSKGKFNLDLDQSYARVALKLTMLSGQQVYSDTQNATEHISFDLDLPAGLYILDVQADELQRKFKLTIE